MTQIFVNIAYQRMTPEGFAFLAQQNLHPEFYFCGDAIDTIERQVIIDLKKLITTNSFRSTLHAPFYDLNIGARDSGVRNASFERLIWALETAAMLGSRIVVVHPGYCITPGDVDVDIWLKRANNLLQKLVEHAASLNLKIAFENIYDKRPDSLAKLLSTVNPANTGICFDVGHHNIFSALPMEAWLDALGSRILECHLHDNDKSADQHRAIGDGNVNFSPLLDWYKSLPDDQRPALTLEQQDIKHVLKSMTRIKSWEI